MSTPSFSAGAIDRAQHEILVVDDNPASRYATVRLLQSVGFRTREAATGAEGLKLADGGISAMVLDVHLPDIDGMELCRILRSEVRDVRIPVLHLTAAYVKDEDKVRGIDAGADAYLTHPVEPAVLVATVQALVRAHMAEDAMRRSEVKFRALYAQAPSGICLLDQEGRFSDANPAMLALLRRSLPEVVGRRISDFAPPGADAPANGDANWPTASGWQGVRPMIDGSGAEVHVEWRVSEPLEPGLTIAVATDVSERISLERARRELLERERAARGEAERVSRLKDDLIAVLSHELRTPLNAIMGWTHVLQKTSTSDEARRGLTAIERNGKTQARLISDILDVSSINMGKLRLHVEVVDAAELLASSVEALRPALDENECTVQLEINGPFAPLHADPARFQQIVWNLVSNAIKFSPRGGQIRVSLNPSDSGVRLSVADDGRGIGPEFLPYLFDRFTQGEVGSNRFHGGLGLGLSIVKHLAELHGGKAAAFSEGLGRGSVFHVDLPLGGAMPGGNADADLSDTGFDDGADLGPADDLTGLSVLLVDDDFEASDMLQLILSERGARVLIAHTADEALEALRIGVPDVLVSDVGMPGRDGYELLQDIRRLEGGQRHLPAIALTSFTRPQDVAQALAAGFDAHCSKPLRPLELARVIADLARRSAPSAPRA